MRMIRWRVILFFYPFAIELNVSCLRSHSPHPLQK